MENNEHAEGIRQSVDDIIGVNTFLRRKKRTEDDNQRERFEKIIRTLEEIEVRGMIIANDLKVDFTTYDEKFYDVVDTLLLMHFGKEASEIIFFYLYERVNPDGTINQLVDTNEQYVTLNSPTDLWELVKIIQSQVGKPKKK
jgi:hypothetical protein